jgi:DNA mismatch endonuclease (patch repair protein)
MRAIRSKNTKPELQVRQLLHAAGFRFRLHRACLPGKPDIVLPKYQVVVFVHGCFWHGHNCHLFKVPATQRDFWIKKIGSNFARDLKDTAKLLELGWRVMTVWECAVKGGQKRTASALMDDLANFIHSPKGLASIDYMGLCQINPLCSVDIFQSLNPSPQISEALNCLPLIPE